MGFYIVSAILLVCGLMADADPSCKSSSCIGVDLYYESLCPDSIGFVTNQLVPAYSELKDHLDINFIPYGKATHKRNEANKWEFTCQHGNSECKGNKAQACAIHVIKESSTHESEQALSTSLVGCVMASSYPASSVPRCAYTVGLGESERQKIIDCVQSSAGDDLLAALGDKTHGLKPALRFVPTIVINGVYSTENQNAALSDFKKLICDLLPAGGKPTSCA